MLRVGEIGFRGRLVLTLTTLVILVGLSIGVLTMVQLFEDEKQRAITQLTVAERVVKAVLENRADTLQSQLELVSQDFGFRTAIASGERATLDSALANHSQRAGADLALVLDRDNQLLAATQALGPKLPTPFLTLLDTTVPPANNRGFLAWGGDGYEMLLIPIEAAGLRARLLAGFKLNAALTSNIRRLAGTDIAFRHHDHSTGIDQLLASSLANLPPLLHSHERDLPHNDIHFFQRLIHLGQTGDEDFDAILMIDRRDALNSYRQQAIKISALIGTSLLLAIVIAVLAARALGKPILSLARYAADIGDNLNPRAPATPSYGELAVLEDTLEKMQRKILQREQRIEFAASHDEITGLLNRLAMVQALRKRLEKGDEVTVVGMSVQALSEINDTLGLSFGDKVLTATGLRLQSQVPPPAIFARTGANEFVALQERLDGHRLENLIKALKANAEQPLQIEQTPFSVQCRFAVLQVPRDATTVDEIRRRLNLTLEAAGHRSDRVAFYTPGEDEFRLRELRLIQELQSAIRNDGLHMHYQPKVAFDSGELVQVEALVRWVHPEYGFISPDEFILLAERSGQIHELTRYILGQIARDASQWWYRGLQIGPAINLSALDLSRPELVDDVLAIFANYPGGLSSVTMEVTESAVMEDTVTALETLTRLRKAGVKLSIDDFGTGHSSLSQLRKLPVQELKIDKSFVLDLQEDDQDQWIVRSTINMAHGLGLRVVAEGIENLTSWQLLQSWGCDLGQGYFLARPMPADELAGWVRTLAESRDALIPHTNTEPTESDS
ncbi:EAL domain-containing protein [Marinobacter sp. CA1]|uniref:bifunctional diguanylate cyclase/phosphodiesterase n=1 Tax=Marinobacter sp. CA1 TaxID=2817656 RepID=UPI001D087649|nr:EAL domain-containing protein [Marinobacter sp. CA1]UDL05000.1 EAL domain-containing protein [Marinobacter sp. CA1]